MSEVDEDLRWEVARLRINELGSVPATFSSLMRSLKSDSQKSPNQLSHISYSELKRLLRSPAALCPFLAAMIEFRPDKLSGCKEPAKAVATVFSIDEICSLVACIYFTRQVKKRCDPEEWKFISEIITPTITIAGHLGSTIEAIGFERAIFTVAATVFGMALFQGPLPKQYTLYRRQLKKTNLFFDTETELKLFRCSNREICSLIAQNIALSSSLASEYLSGLETAPGQRPDTATQALGIWMKSLFLKGSAPQEAMNAKWYPTKEQVDIILDAARRTHASSQQRVCWLLRDAESLNSLLEEFADLSGNKSDVAELDLSKAEEPSAIDEN